MTTITFNAETYELEASGHSGMEKDGKDIVCASVTTLVFTLYKSLAESAEMLKKDSLEVKMSNGYAKISCTPKKKFEPHIQLIYWVILNGIDSLCESYGEYVTFKEK